MKKRGIWCVLLCLFLLGGCAVSAPLTRDTVAMDTVISISLYDKQDERLIAACFDRLVQYEALFSRTDPDSEIARLNAAAGEAMSLSADTCALLALGKQFGERTNGAFDITIAPVSALWDFASGTLPDAAALADAAERVDHRALEVTDTSAKLETGMAVDLGGIAKGYAADRLAEYLRDEGVESALIDLGGNVYALGDKHGKPFSVGIRDPQNEAALAAVVQVRDKSVVTSGVYERGFTKDGVRYHHLLDPQTGYPVQNGLASVTIVAEKSVEADALSTACFVLGVHEGMALVEATDGVEALFIAADGTLTASSGLQYEER